MSQFFSPKTPTSVAKVFMRWATALSELGDSIQSATWTITNTTDPDEDTSSMLVGSPDWTTSPGKVIQKVQGGTAGCVYMHVCTVTTTGGQTLSYKAKQTCKALS